MRGQPSHRLSARMTKASGTQSTSVSSWTVDDRTAELLARFDGRPPERVLRDSVDKVFRGSACGCHSLVYGTLRAIARKAKHRPSPHQHEWIAPGREAPRALPATPQRSGESFGESLRQSRLQVFNLLLRNLRSRNDIVDPVLYFVVRCASDGEVGGRS